MVTNLLTRLFLTVLMVCAAAASFAGTLTVTSPTEGSFLGSSNTLRYSISGATVEVTVRAVITGPGGTIFDNTVRSTPDSNGKITGSMPLNINQATPEGDYVLTVTAMEPGNSYTPQTVNVIVDVSAPKIVEFSPISGGFVRDIVQIRANVNEANIKDWRVKVNGQDIPNNTGTTNTVAVDWDTANVDADGSQTITITVQDQADNTATQTISVTLDRVKPTITIVYPTASSKLVPNTTISVIVDIADASTSSIDATGVDVVIRGMDGSFIARVAKVSAKGQGSNVLRWTGRIRHQRWSMPNQFKIVATAIDRAGNVGTAQEITINLGKSRSPWGRR